MKENLIVWGLTALVGVAIFGGALGLMAIIAHDFHRVGLI